MVPIATITAAGPLTLNVYGGIARVRQRGLLHLQERALHAHQVGGDLHRGPEDLHRIRGHPGCDAAAAGGLRPERHDLHRDRRAAPRAPTTTAGHKPRDDVGGDLCLRDGDPVRSGLRFRSRSRPASPVGVSMPSSSRSTSPNGHLLHPASTRCTTSSTRREATPTWSRSTYPMTSRPSRSRGPSTSSPRTRSPSRRAATTPSRRS